MPIKDLQDICPMCLLPIDECDCDDLDDDDFFGDIGTYEDYLEQEMDRV